MGFQIEFRGIVQGVGFRPFVYKTALKIGVYGFVKNTGFGAVVKCDCNEKKLKSFLNEIRKSLPSIARIDEIKIKKIKGQWREFSIQPSANTAEIGSVSPDVGICESCLNELFDFTNRRFLHPFINCTDCGPRFTVVEKLPYDRSNTSMKSFEMCPACREEFSDAYSRRFHAQPISCNECGPKYVLLDSKLRKVTDWTVVGTLLKKGKLVAVKGIGGFHISCNALDVSALKKLRKLKARITKPFAVMAKSVEKAEEACFVGEDEKKVLKSNVKPIVLLTSKNILPSELNPKLDSIGIMLPYAPIHHLLFYYSNLDFLVMTSGNLSGEPIITRNEEAFEKLKGVVDFFLLHDREIVNGCDDSILKKDSIIRYSRGFAPQPLNFDFGEGIALGGELNSNFAISRKRKVYVSQYFGDLSNHESFSRFKKSFWSFSDFFKIKTKNISCDLHPGFQTTRFAESLTANSVKVQHHFAHLYSCMGENHLKEAVGVVCDGFGYGIDGSAWGGEVLTSDGKRFGHIEEFKLIGVDEAVRKPERILFSILRKNLSLEECERFFEKRKVNVDLLEEMMNKNINTMNSTSCGRVLDAASFACNVCNEMTYDGEPAMQLEAFADKSIKTNPLIEKNNLLISGLFSELSFDKRFAGKIHDYIARGLGEIAVEACDSTGFDSVCLSGGVMYNQIIVKVLRETLEKNKIKVFTQKLLPCGDGGLSFGQLYYNHCKKI
ncbi:MAG: carbamoyltransferase HypF [Candidatus Marsarchaeota archaeon]|nr:carbamoyltransferase HypF [Candidatus Marsarchaeota archaeon]